MDNLMHEVSAHIRRVADEVIRPRFRALEAHEISEKLGPNDLVTIADVESELALTAALGEVLPGVPVVGEEAVAADPTVLDALAADRVWIVDPIDGTGNFVAGNPEYGVIVALVDRGVTVAGWIHRPETGADIVAQRGAGAWIDGRRVRREDVAVTASQISGIVKPRYLPAAVADAITARVHEVAGVLDYRNCAAVEYECVTNADPDFAFYWMTKPWDHAAGSLIIEEAGGCSRRLDGTTYAAGLAGSGLLVAGTPSIWSAVRASLLADVV